MTLSMLLTIFILPLLVAAVFAYLLSPLVIFIYQHLNWLDDPQTKTHQKVVHTYPVPRGGGLVIFLALLAGSLLFLDLDKHLIGILSGAFVIALIGLVDDTKDINPYWRLLAGFLAAGLVVLSGIGIAYVSHPFEPGVIDLSQPQLAIYLFGETRSLWLLADLFALIWITWCMNFLNWSKGLDGQLPGIVVVAALIIASLSFRFSGDITQWPVSILAGITAGAYLGFLPWNLFPQKMMPGYGGGALAGFLLATLSILSGAKLATLILVLAIPMLDAIYVIIGRLSRGQSPVWGDRSHFHHRLLDLGFPKRIIALFYWSVTLILGIITLHLNTRQKLVTIILLAIVFGAVLLWLNYSTPSPERSAPANGSKT